MSAKVLAIANQKGGVGKTTTSLSLGSALSRMGQKVLLLDLDPHACATLHAKLYPENIQFSLFDIFQGKDANYWASLWPKVIHRQALQGMDIAPSSIRLSELEVDYKDRADKGSVLLQCLNSLADEYDFVVLDCPPHVGILLINALVASDLLIIPIQTDFLALHGLKLLFDTLHTLNKVLPRPISYRAVPTMYDKRAKACTRVLDLMHKKMTNALFSTIIGIDTRFREASALGCTIYDIAPNSRGALNYADLAKEVVALW